MVNRRRMPWLSLRCAISISSTSLFLTTLRAETRTYQSSTISKAILANMVLSEGEAVLARNVEDDDSLGTIDSKGDGCRILILSPPHEAGKHEEDHRRGNGAVPEHAVAPRLPVAGRACDLP